MLKSVLKGVQVLLLLGTFIAMAYLLKKDFQAEHLQILLKQAHIFPLAAAVGAAFIGLLLKIIRLVDMCRAFNIPLTIKRSFDIQVMSISLGIITPGRAGEFSKVFLLSERSAQPKSAKKQALLLMIIERLMDMLVLALLGGAFLLFTFATHLTTIIPLAIVALTLVLFMSYRLYPRFEQRFKNKLSWLSGGSLLRWLGLSFTAWIFDGVFQLFILASINLHPNAFKVVGLNAIVAIAGVLSLLPVGLGTVDLSALYLYNYSVNLQQSEIIYLLAAGRVLGLGLLFGLFAMVLLKHPGLYQRLKHRKNLSKEPMQ